MNSSEISNFLTKKERFPPCFEDFHVQKSCNLPRKRSLFIILKPKYNTHIEPAAWKVYPVFFCNFELETTYLVGAHPRNS